MATIKKDIGAYSAYAIAVKHGYKGTEAEWVAAQEKARVDSEAAAKAAKTAQEAAEAAREQAQTAKTSAETAQTAAAQAAQTATGAAGAATQASQAAQTAKEAAEQAQTGAQNAKTGAKTANTEAQAAKTAAEKAAQEAKAAQTGAVEAKTLAETAQGKAEEAAQGVAADREQIGANKSGLEAAQQELTATKEQLTETKAALATTQEDLKKAQRAIQFQAELNRGQTWDFEEDDQEAYQRTVPSGAKAGAVMAVGGKTVVWNQISDDWKTVVKNAILYFPKGQTIAAGHQYLISYDAAGDAENVTTKIILYYRTESGSPVECGTVSSTGAGKKKGITTATQSGISNLTADITGSVWLYIYNPNGGVDNIKISDLTLMFGSGNEPTDTSAPRIAKIEAYAAAHPEYNAGELVSALVDEARVAGKNIAKPVSAFSKSGITMTVDKDGIYHFSGTALETIYATSEQFVLPGGTYTVSINAATPANVYLSVSSLTQLMVGANTVKTGKFEGGIAYIYFYIRKGVVMDNVFIAFQVERGSASTAYSPHRDPVTFPIPSAVQSLPGYGWSAGSVANTIERTENGWQYVQRVGSVDLGTLAWHDGVTATSARRMNSRTKPDNAKIPISASDTPNVICKTYDRVSPNETWLCTKEGVTLNAKEGNVVVYDSQYSTAESLAAFKQHVQGVMLYYELSTPITTDITTLMGDSLAPFAVESGGSITLHHPKADEGFTIDVPAKVQYITKLSEVSANG